jgi:hypothetical protein
MRTHEGFWLRRASAIVKSLFHNSLRVLAQSRQKPAPTGWPGRLVPNRGAIVKRGSKISFDWRVDLLHNGLRASFGSVRVAPHHEAKWLFHGFPARGA